MSGGLRPRRTAEARLRSGGLLRIIANAFGTAAELCDPGRLPGESSPITPSLGSLLSEPTWNWRSAPSKSCTGPISRIGSMIANLGYMSLDWRSLGNDGWAHGGE